MSYNDIDTTSSCQNYNRLLNEAAYLPRCSDGKEALRKGELKIRPREYAVKRPYMQVNRLGMVSWLVFDLDHNNPLIWEDESLPPPNLIVQNRNNGHSHIYYAISPVCTTENARSKPIQYMKAVYEAMAARLDADPAYRGPVAKTPGHQWWLTTELHTAEYTLGELHDYLELADKSPWSKGPDLDAVSHSRHCLLFEETRFYAYSIVNRERNSGTFERFNRLVEAFARNKNNFSTRGFTQNLTEGQLKATVKSVCRWTWDKYQGNTNCHKGVMGLDKSQPIEIRQRQAAQRTHQVRRTETESKIRSACRTLIEIGTKITYMAIAEQSGLSRQTVAKYKHIIDTTKPVEIIPLSDPAPKSQNVNYAIHQISAHQGQGKESERSERLFSAFDGAYCNKGVEEVLAPTPLLLQYPHQSKKDWGGNTLPTSLFLRPIGRQKKQLCKKVNKKPDKGTMESKNKYSFDVNKNSISRKSLK